MSEAVAVQRHTTLRCKHVRVPELWKRNAPQGVCVFVQTIKRYYWYECVCLSSLTKSPVGTYFRVHVMEAFLEVLKSEPRDIPGAEKVL